MNCPARSLRVSWFLAVRSFARGNFGVTTMTVALMAIIYINVLFLPSLIAGAVDAINRQIIETTTSDLVISSADGDGTIDDVAAYLDEITATPGAASATATLRVGTQVSHGSESNAWAVDAIDPVAYAQVFTTPGHLIEGDYLTADDVDGVLLGIGIAGADQTELRTYSSSLKTVHPGDVVMVTLTGGTQQAFTVRGVYQNDFPLSDQGALITDAAAARFLPAAGDLATAIHVKSDGVPPGELADRLAEVRSDVSLQTPDQLTAAIQDQIEAFELIDSIMRAISLLVAAVTVFIITYVDLVNRRRQIGIERAIGIKASAIVGSYVIRAVVNAVIGTAAGLAVFHLLVMPLVERHPFMFPTGPAVLVSDPGDAVRNLVLLVVVSVASVLVPAFRTVRMKILDAIWGT